MIDWTRIAELEAEIGADDLAEVLALFIEEADHEIARLRAGVPARDLPASLHFLKGAALNLGFARLADLCGSGQAMDVAALLDCYDASRRSFLAATDQTRNSASSSSPVMSR